MKFIDSLSEHIYKIVKRLQEMKYLCGMPGDGVNNALALKKAYIGIAVAEATDAARIASGIVLTEPGLTVIFHAVVTSQFIFQRMKNYMVSLIKILSQCPSTDISELCQEKGGVLLPHLAKMLVFQYVFMVLCNIVV